MALAFIFVLGIGNFALHKAVLESGHPLLGQMPWLRIQNGHITPESKRSVDEVFLKLGGKVFFQNVEPMKSRSKCPRRGWSEFVSELVAFSKSVSKNSALYRIRQVVLVGL